MIGCLRERCSVMRHARLLVPGLTLWALLAPARLWAMADESPQIESEAVPAQQEAQVSNQDDGSIYVQSIDPGAPTANGKIVKRVGDYHARFYGTLLMNFSAADSRQLGQDIPLWPLPGNIPITLSDGTVRRAGIAGETFFTMRQSVLGFQMTKAEPSG